MILSGDSGEETRRNLLSFIEKYSSPPGMNSQQALSNTETLLLLLNQIQNIEEFPSCKIR